MTTQLVLCALTCCVRGYGGVTDGPAADCRPAVQTWPTHPKAACVMYIQGGGYWRDQQCPQLKPANQKMLGDRKANAQTLTHLIGSNACSQLWSSVNMSKVVTVDRRRSYLTSSARPVHGEVRKVHSRRDELIYTISRTYWYNILKKTFLDILYKPTSQVCNDGL